MEKILVLIVITLMIILAAIFFLDQNKIIKENNNSNLQAQSGEIHLSSNDEDKDIFESGETKLDISETYKSGEKIDFSGENIDSNSKEDSLKNITDFDFKLLKSLNENKNMIYSPLSAKYALKMLEEASKGETKSQISKLIGDLSIKNYKSSKNMSLANSFFIRDSFKEDIKDSYIKLLSSKYNADIKFDEFKSADNINSWVSEKTFEIIPTILENEDVESLDFALINALAIDMEWERKFFGEGQDAKYLHEESDLQGTYLNIIQFSNIESPKSFKGFKNVDDDISAMDIDVTINNYDIVKEIGEDKMKEIVKSDMEEKKKSYTDDEEGYFPGDFEEFWKSYFDQIKENYHNLGFKTDFSIYNTDDVKVFAKDLKEYDGTTLQYIGIMPTKDSLDDFINKLDTNKIKEYITNLKSITDYNNFKEGVVTKIIGKIPKFNFKYLVNLKEELIKYGVTDDFLN